MLQIKQRTAAAKTISLRPKPIKRKIAPTQIAISSNGRIDLIDIDDILFLKASSNYTEVHLKNGRELITSHTLKKYEQLLSSDKFVRVHNSYIIRQSELKSFLPKQNTILLRNDQKIPVSRSRKEGIMKHLKMIMVSLAFILFSIQANAQFTSWQQGAPSDWYVNFSWSGPTNWACDCLGNATDRFIIHGPGDPENIFIEETRPHQSGSFSGTNQYEAFPNALVSFDAFMNVSGATNNFFMNSCATTCGAGYGGSTVTFTTEPLRPPSNVTHTVNADGTVTFNFDVTTDIPEGPGGYLLTWNWNGGPFFNSLSKSTTSLTLCPPSDNATFSIWTRQNLGNGYESEKVNVVINQGPPVDGQISGTIKTTVGSGVGGVVVKATLLNPQDFTCLNNEVFMSEPSQQSGSFTIDAIKYHPNVANAVYRVEPMLAGHQFRYPNANSQDSTIDYTMTMSTHTFGDADFIDITSYTIAGKVTDALGCGVDSVRISATPGTIPVVFTDGSGNYELVVPEGGLYNVETLYKTQSLGTLNVNVPDANVNDQDFSYNDTHTISGYVGAGCFEYIGEATVQFRTKGGCLLENVQTNLNGYFIDVTLPSREVSMEVINFSPLAGQGLDPFDILNDIGGIKNIDLTSDTTINTFYRKPISFEFEGIPAPPCPAVEYPVFNQTQPYPITIKVWESIGICPADSGVIYIQNNISAIGLQTTVLDTVQISNGEASFMLIPGEPALQAPYLKTITFTAFVDSQMVTQTLEGIVSGTRQRTQTIVTGAPTELPYLILRDPPGDASYSFFEENASTTYSQSYSHLVGGGVRVWAKASLEAPVFPGIKAFGEIGGGIAAGGDRTSSTEFKTTLSHNTSIETSSEEGVIGEDGDLVYGAAVNFVYGLADERIFDVNTCQMTVDTGLIFSPDTFETKFIKTIKGIRENLIPDLNFLATNPDTTEEARRRFRSEAKKWEQVIQMNEELKAEALQNPIDNYTIESAVGPFSLSTTASTSELKTIEFKDYLNADIAISGGLNFLEAVEFEAGVEVTIRGEWGRSESTEITESTTTGFVFDDTGDLFNDEISFDYATGGVYGTPVFGDPIGRTSCPHEAGTQFIDFPQIVAPAPVKFVPAGDDEIEFTLLLRNNSESDFTRTYQLDFIEQSNEFGALVFNGANPFSGTIPFTIAAGGQASVTVRIERPGASDQYSFEGLQFDLYPECEPLLKSTTFISAYFENSCPNITMPAPTNNWAANMSNNNMVSVVMDNYVLDPSVDEIRLVYLPLGSQEAWKETNVVIPGPNLLPPPQTYNWDISGIPDGEYIMRWELYCGNTVNTSVRVCGAIDRKMPQVFGTEQPRDDVYHPGDLISVTFDELIDFTTLQNGNFYVQNLTTDESVSATISHQQSQIFVQLGVDIVDMYNEAFEIGLINVADTCGNMRPDTVTWQFVVSEPDTDRDGIRDLSDRCPGGDDKADTDMDGLPDDCDCLPTIPQNGRALSKAAMDFDGVDDQIVIPHDPAFNPTQSFTFESWVKLNEINIAETILSKGEGGSTSTSYIFSVFQDKIALYIGDGAANATWIYSDTDVEVGEWVHAAVSYNQATSEFTFYRNGVEDGVRTIPHGFYASTSPVYIGRQGEICNCNFLSGQLEDIRFWNVAKTENEIQASMQIELQGDQPGLIAYYDLNDGIPFGDNDGVVVVSDATDNGRDGVATNFEGMGTSSNWVNSPVSVINATYDICRNCVDTLNAAIDFDGVNDYLIVPNNPSFAPTTSNEVTYELWLNPVEGGTNYSDLIFFMPGNVSVNRSNLGISIATSGLATTSSIDANKWTHLAIVFETNRLKMYRDGIIVFDNPFSHQAANSGNELFIGGSNANATNLFDGQMDDFRIWNHARTATQIEANMFQEQIGNETDLVAYFDFNDGLAGGDNTAKTAATDRTGNGNSATLQNFIRNGGYSNWVLSALNFRIDEDGDGRPDACDDCIPQSVLVLDNMSLNGVYQARDKIILGNGVTFPANAEVLFRTPELEIMENVDAPTGVQVLVNPEPCEE